MVKTREANYFDVGVLGRKTGITLRQGERDEHGIERIEGIFSSPAKRPSPAKLPFTVPAKSTPPLPVAQRTASPSPPRRNGVSQSPNGQATAFAVKRGEGRPPRPRTPPPRGMANIEEEDEEMTARKRKQATPGKEAWLQGQEGTQSQAQRSEPALPRTPPPMRSHAWKSPGPSPSKAGPNAWTTSMRNDPDSDGGGLFVTPRKSPRRARKTTVEEEIVAATDAAMKTSMVAAMEASPRLFIEEEDRPLNLKRKRDPPAASAKGHVAGASGISGDPARNAYLATTNMQSMREQTADVLSGGPMTTMPASLAAKTTVAGTTITPTKALEPATWDLTGQEGGQYENSQLITRSAPAAKANGRLAPRPMLPKPARVASQSAAGAMASSQAVDEEPIRRGRGRPKGAKNKPKPYMIPADEKPEPWEMDPGVISGAVRLWDQEQEAGVEYLVEDEIAYSASAISALQVPTNNNSFKYAKTLTLPFFGAGMVELPPLGVKRPKNSRKMQMVFCVVAGRVNVEVSGNTFRMSRGGIFQVPRGNQYAISNDSTTDPARVFFAQGCESDLAGMVENNIPANVAVNGHSTGGHRSGLSHSDVPRGGHTSSAHGRHDEGEIYGDAGPESAYGGEEGIPSFSASRHQAYSNNGSQGYEAESHKMEAENEEEPVGDESSYYGSGGNGPGVSFSVRPGTGFQALHERDMTPSFGALPGGHAHDDDGNVEDDDEEGEEEDQAEREHPVDSYQQHREWSQPVFARRGATASRKTKGAGNEGRTRRAGNGSGKERAGTALPGRTAGARKRERGDAGGRNPRTSKKEVARGGGGGGGGGGSLQMVTEMIEEDADRDRDADGDEMMDDDGGQGGGGRGGVFRRPRR